jgi:hypothetical protein
MSETEVIAELSSTKEELGVLAGRHWPLSTAGARHLRFRTSAAGPMKTRGRNGGQSEPLSPFPSMRELIGLRNNRPPNPSVVRAQPLLTETDQRSP